MKRTYLLTLLLLCVVGAVANNSATLPYGYPQSERTKSLLNAGWRFHLGDPEAEYFRTNTDDSRWEVVSVPHSLELTDITLNGSDDDLTQPTFNRNVGWYRKDIFVEKSNRRVYIEFEGVQQVTTLWVNGKRVGIHDIGGYTPFYFDITNYVKRGAKNQITILADNRVNQFTPPDPDKKDFVIFGGIYRDLYLVEKSPVHITSNLDSARSGVSITTPSIDVVNGNATINILTEVRNQSNKSQTMTLTQRVVDANGNVVLKLSDSFTIEAGDRYLSTLTGGVDSDVRFWSVDYPYLYKVNTTLCNSSGEAVDVVDNRLGLRSINLDPETGLHLNGKQIKLVGYNRHQNYGFIGDAAPNSLHYRDIAQLKELGINSIRTSHYPQDDELIRACDELGILVYEEPPTWHGISSDEEWYANLHKAARAMIRNHKNSPSIIIWGAGVNHRGVVADMQFLIKEEDPTRLTGSQNSRWTGNMTSSWSDIYANMNYIQSIWEREEPQVAMEGNSGPAALAPYMREDKRIGMLSWVSSAYYTFSHDTKPGADRTHSYGDLDVFRYPRKSAIKWYPAEMKLKPYLYIVDDWSEELQMLTIYSNATEVELIVNGKSQGRFRPSTSLKYNGLKHPPFEITEFDYESGEIEVIGYREGEVIAQQKSFTPTKATSLRLYADIFGVEMKADNNDIVILHAEAVDENGVHIRNYAGEVRYTITSGDASIVGDHIGKGYNPAQFMVGGASALIRAGERAGQIVVTASCEGLKPATITLESKPSTTDMVAQCAYPIYDKEVMMVDMGSPSQNNQFAWTPWVSEEKGSSEVAILYVEPTNYAAGSLPAASARSRVVKSGTQGAYNFKVAPSTSGELKWIGGMSPIGKDNNLFADGVLCTGVGGVTLTIGNLPAGEYSIKCYHHSPSALPKAAKGAAAIVPARVSAYIDGKPTRAQNIEVTYGGQMQYDIPAASTVHFTIEKSGESVKFSYKADHNEVWINGFELTRKL